MKKTDKISKDRAIDIFMKRHKNKLLDVFGSEASARAHLKYDVPNTNETMRRSTFTVKFNNYLEISAASDSLREFTEAKINATNKDELLNTLNKTNMRGIRYNKTAIEAGFDLDNDTVLEKYFEVKGDSGMVLASVITSVANYTWQSWRYINRKVYNF